MCGLLWWCHRKIFFLFYNKRRWIMVPQKTGKMKIVLFPCQSELRPWESPSTRLYPWHEVPFWFPSGLSVSVLNFLWPTWEELCMTLIKGLLQDPLQIITIEVSPIVIWSVLKSRKLTANMSQKPTVNSGALKKRQSGLVNSLNL